MKNTIRMKKILSVIILTLLCGANLCLAVKLNNEKLKYVITYKWGLIHKDAGEALVTLTQQGNNYNVVLTAKSYSWADRIYKVRDTLCTNMRMTDLKPILYIKRMHEGNKYNIDEIKFSYSGNVTDGVATRKKIINGKSTESTTNLSATGPVFDFLSLFYYLRKLDYTKLSKNIVYKATVFSGKKKESVMIKSLGIQTIKLRDKSSCNAYHIKFNFTQHGGKKSSDDIDAWISTDSAHVPLQIIGSLPVGEIRIYLVK